MIVFKSIYVIGVIIMFIAYVWFWHDRDMCYEDNRLLLVFDALSAALLWPFSMWGAFKCV